MHLSLDREASSPAWNHERTGFEDNPINVASKTASLAVGRGMAHISLRGFIFFHFFRFYLGQTCHSLSFSLLVLELEYLGCPTQRYPSGRTAWSGLLLMTLSPRPDRRWKLRKLLRWTISKALMWYHIYVGCWSKENPTLQILSVSLVTSSHLQKCQFFWKVDN